LSDGQPGEGMNKQARIYVLSTLLGLLLVLSAGYAHAEPDVADNPLDFDSETTILTNGPVPPFRDMALRSEVQNYIVYYPAFGISSVDKIIADWAAELVADAPPEAVVENINGDRYVIYEMQARYSLSASTPRYFSVVFFTTQTVMDRRENIIYTLNFDIQAQKAMELKDIFSDLEEGLPHLAELIRKTVKVSRQDDSTIDLPWYIEDYDGVKEEFASFLTMAFSPEGFNVYLSSTEMVLAHRRDLVEIGARATLWRN
jgi:hypothetical protein